jgi:hypothetical protein
MAYIESGSEASMLLESHLFYLPSTLTERWNTRDCEVGPSQAVFDDAPDIIFNVAASHNELISMADIRFSCDLLVLKADGTNIGPMEDIAPINNVLHSLFQSVTVTLGGRCVTDSSNLYHYRAYLENLLGYTTRAQETQLSCVGWAMDTNFGSPVIEKDTFTSKGAGELRNRIINGKVLQLSGKLHIDLFQQDKPLLPGVEFSVRLVRNKIALTFLAAKSEGLPKVALRNPRLHLRKYEPSPDFLNALSKQLVHSTAKYHIERTTMRTLTLMKGQQQATWSNLVIGPLPKVMLLGLVGSEGFAGQHNKTPFNFQHFDVSNIHAEVNGQLFPTKAYEMNYSQDRSLTAYEGLLDCLERLNEPAGELPFDRWEYPNGFCIYGFDFTAGHTGRGSLALIKHGNLNINMTFSKELPEGVVLIAMMVFDNVIEIDNNRQVLFDFAP